MIQALLYYECVGHRSVGLRRSQALVVFIDGGSENTLNAYEPSPHRRFVWFTL